MSNLLKAAELRLVELNQRLRSMSVFREMEATRRYVEELRGLGGTPADLDQPATPQMDERSTTPKHSRRPTWAELAVSVLHEIGRPVSSRRLVMEMAKRGHNVGGAKPEINLASILSKAKSVTSVQWGGRKRWWPAGYAVPLEPEGNGENDSTGSSPNTSSPADSAQTL